MKIRPVGAEVFHADGETDRHDEANSRFSQWQETHCIFRLRVAYQWQTQCGRQ